MAKAIQPAVRSSRIAMATTVIVLALCAVAAYWLGTGTWRDGLISPGLRVDPANLDLGEVWEDDHFNHTISVENPTPTDITIDRFTSSRSCISVQPTSLIIPAGKHADVRLTMDLVLGPPKGEQDRLGKDVEIHISPCIRGEAVPYQADWVVHGRVRRVLTLEPREVDFGTNLQGEPIAPKRVAVKGTGSLRALEAVCPEALGTVDVSRVEGNAQQFLVTITPHPTLPPGPFQFSTTLKPVGRDGQRLPAVKVPVEGVVKGEYQLVPQALLLGVRSVGELVVETVVIHSARNKPFMVQTVEVGGADTQVEPALPCAACGREFRVVQRVAEPGMQVRTVRFLLRTQGWAAPHSLVHSK